MVAGWRTRVGRRAWLAMLVGVGCDDTPATHWAGTVDTLANGAVQVANPSEGLWEPGEEWTLVEDLRLGRLEGGGPEVFGRISDLEVDGEGRIYVLDVQAREVRIFDRVGAHVATFGRAGQGPGELSRPSALDLGPGGVWVIDVGNQRYAIIDSVGRLVEERPRFTTGQVSPWPGAVLADSGVIDVDYGLVDGQLKRTWLIHRPSAGTGDTVTVPSFDGPAFVHTTESSQVSAAVPFAPRLHTAFDGEGSIWAGISDRYRIARTDLNGDTSLVIERAFEPIPVTGAEKDAALAGFEWFTRQGGSVERSAIPDRHPVFRAIHLDRAGHLWVEPTVARTDEVTAETLYRPGPAVFDIFNPDGRYLGRAASGVTLSNPRITRRHVYGITTDELGAQYVVRLRVEGRQ